MALTALQRRFAAEYQTDCNAVQAAIRAGYSPKTARAKTSQLLRNPEIRALIRAGEQERLEQMGVTQERVIMELARIAFSDMRAAVQWDESGAIARASRSLSRDEAAAIAELIANTDAQSGSAHVRVKLYDKLKALEMLSRHLGVFKDGSGGVQQHLAAGATVNMHISYVGTAPSDGASGDRQ